jgi:hypothetical protein
VVAASWLWFKPLPDRQGTGSGTDFRPLAQTILDTLTWDAYEGKPNAGLSPEQEAALLEAWRQTQQ